MRHSEPITSTIFFCKSSDCSEKTTYWQLIDGQTLSSGSEKWLQLNLYAARSNNCYHRPTLKLNGSITYLKHISPRQLHWLLLWIDAIIDHCVGAATFSRLDLVGFDKNDKHSFTAILEYSNMAMDMEHLYPAKNINRLRLSTNLLAVKRLIQLVDHCFIAEAQDWD